MKISPEADFISAMCTEFDTGSLERLERLSATVKDWSLVTSLAKSHGVAPLLLAKLGDHGSNIQVSPDALDGLRQTAIREIAITSRLNLALVELLESFEYEGLGVITLKGAALATMLYEDPAQRSFTDIDLMCREEDYSKVYDAITGLGYRPQESRVLPHRHSTHESYFESHFVHSENLFQVELHVDSLKLGVRPHHASSVWERAVPFELNGSTGLTLGVEDQFLMLSVHLHRHGFSRLIWFKDIDLLLRKYNESIDWSLVVSETRSEGVTSSLWYTALLLKKVFRTPISSDIIDALKPQLLSRLALWTIWPEKKVMNLQSATKRRAVQFSTSESIRGVIPSLILMGRRRQKLDILAQKLLRH